MMFASQFDSEVGNCSFEFKHACLGRPRVANVPALKSFFLGATRISTQQGHSDEHALEPLDRLLRHVARRPPCIFTFVGDSTTTDFFVATLLGALRLGWRRLSSCGAFGANYLRGENRSEGFFKRSCNLGKSFPYVWMFKAFHPEVRLHRQCRRLMLRLYLPEKTAADSVQQKNAEYVVSRSSYVCLNWGVRRNDRQGLINHFEELIKPFLDTQQFDKLIWRTSLPQHFKGKDGSGLFESRYRDSAPSCGPVTDKVANNWRNTLFTQWLRSHLGSTAHKLYQIDVNDYFLERHDLHSTGDCTHYLYSPFAYFHLWQAIVQILRSETARVPA